MNEKLNSVNLFSELDTDISLHVKKEDDFENSSYKWNVTCSIEITIDNIGLSSPARLLGQVSIIS